MNAVNNSLEHSGSDNPWSSTQSERAEQAERAAFRAEIQKNVADAKEVRKTALINARQALEEAFGQKYKNFINDKLNEEMKDVTPLHTVKQKVNDEVEKEIKEPLSPTPLSSKDAVKIDTKKLEETKQLVKNFREKVSKYPKYISYDGSMVLCVLLSMSADSRTHISNLPAIDQKTIRSMIPEAVAKQFEYLNVRFDENKDFVIGFSDVEGKSNYDVQFVMFNAVAHPRQEDLKDSIGSVPVEKEGDKIAVGGKIVMNKRSIQRLVGFQKDKDKDDEEEVSVPRRQPVAGRNAYEIRADVLQMALDWASESEDYKSDDDVISLAKKFYQFVENKR